MSMVTCKNCKYASESNITDSVFCTRYNIACSKTLGCEMGKPSIKTNADYIRAMTDDELAELIYNFDSMWDKFCLEDAEVVREQLCQVDDCRICIKDWLKKGWEDGRTD